MLGLISSLLRRVYTDAFSVGRKRPDNDVTTRAVPPLMRTVMVDDIALTQQFR